MPKISIVIPAYNVEAYLSETLAGVRAQTFPDWEAIVVDDGSADATFTVAAEFAERDPRVHAHRRANAGGAAARNAGLQLTDAGSEFVAFLDSDDIWEPDALARLAAALVANPRAVAAHGLCRWIDAQSRLLPAPADARLSWQRRAVLGSQLVTCGREAPTTFAVLVVENCITTPGMALIRRPAAEAVMPFDSRAGIAADWDLWLRLSLLGDIAFVDRPILRYRRHDGNVSRGTRRMERCRRYVRHKLLRNSSLSTEQRRIAQLGYRCWKLELSGLWWRWAQHSLTDRRYLQAVHQARRAVTARTQYQLCLLIRS